MEGRRFLRHLFLIFTVVFLVVFTLQNIPSTPSSGAELLDCATNSPWCTFKNRFQAKTNGVLKNPTKSTRRRHDAASDVPRHPLDPLTVQELNKVREIMKSYEPFKTTPYVLHYITLDEPEKRIVSGWKTGDPLPTRKASVVARTGSVSHELTVNLDSGEVTLLDTGRHPGSPMLTIEDMLTAVAAPLANAEFNRTITERGVDIADLACLPISSGWYGK